jgi:signal recognition particle receptor subunit beta
VGLNTPGERRFQRDRRAIWKTSLESLLLLRARGCERQLRELFDADAFESQSCGFGKLMTSKLLLFRDPRDPYPSYL